MYFEHFGLTTSPFNNTPDPRFFFNTPDHEEALASLLYAIEERKGFVLVTGEVGAGKTLLSRMVLNRVGSNVKTALITHTRLTGPELLAAICREFEIDLETGATSVQAMRALEEFLLDQYARDRLAVVIIDEAQNLPAEALEELRMLGNLEADDAKLLQVLLLGQPELQETFRSPAMRQSFQRIFRTFHLRALDRPQTRAYIEHRMRVAGLSSTRGVFEDSAIDAIFQHTDGIPRLINQLCDNALLSAFSDSRNTVSDKLILEVVEQMMSLTAPPAASRPAAALAARFAASSNPAVCRDWTAGEKVSPATPSKDAYLRGLSDRLSDFENRVRVSAREDSTPAAESGGSNSATRDLRNDAAELLRTVTTTVRDADIQMREMLERAHRTAEAVQSRAMAGAAAAYKSSDERRAQVLQIFDGAPCFTNDQKSVLIKVLEEGRAELEAARELRRQADEMCRRAAESQAASERSVKAAMTEAGGITQRIEQEALSLLADARRENNELKGGLTALMKEIQTRNEVAEQRAADYIGGRHAEFESLRRAFDEFAARFSERESMHQAEYEKVVTELKSQAREAVETIHAVRDRTGARAEQVAARAEELLRDMQARSDTAQARVVDLTVAAEERFKTATTSLTTIRDQLLADAEGSRVRASQLLRQAEETLSSTREQCSTLLVEMRAQAETHARKAEESFQSRVAEGLATLTEITTTLAEARRATDQSREELESLIQRATSEVVATRQSLETALAGHRGEIARLSNDAGAIKVDFQMRFEEARSALDAAIQEHRKIACQRADELSNAIDRRLTTAQVDAEHHVRALQGDLRVAGETALRISTELKTAVELADGQIRECQGRIARDTESIQREITQLIEKNRATIEGTRAQVTSLSRQAGETAGTMRNEISMLREAARSRIETAAREFEQLLNDTSRSMEALRGEADKVAVDFAERLVNTRDLAEKAVAESEKAAMGLRQQTKMGLVEVRECLLQMTDRADQLRRELANMGDDITASARTSTDQVQKAGDRVAAQIESIREAVQRDAEANFKRLALIRRQVEQGGEQMRENAARLLDQVQNGAVALRSHADELISRAQSGSDKINETAAQLLRESQAASERFREQAESLLHKAESTAGEIKCQIQTLKAQVTGEVEQVRHQVTAARGELADARQSAEQITEQTSAAAARSQARTDEMLRQAEAAQATSESLLSMPRELVEEAKRQAQALSHMSRKISTVVKQLSTAEAQAERNRSELQHATHAADEKVDLLKRHTERLGQLVGIIRQLYGTMDARIERLRGRLGQVDEIVRTVPHEIESHKAAFDADDAMSPPRSSRMPLDQGADHNRHSGGVAVLNAAPPRATTKAKPQTSRTSTAVSPVLKQQPATTGTELRATPAPSKTVHPATGSTKPVAAPPLGDIAKKNQKINEWLKEMISEEALMKRTSKET